MADQQDQSSSGGSVEKASAAADTSKVRGKGSSSGYSGYRKRQSTSAIADTVEEKRRRQITGDPQTSQIVSNTAHTHSIDSSKGEVRLRGERRSHGAGLESYPGIIMFICTFAVYLPRDNVAISIFSIFHVLFIVVRDCILTVLRHYVPILAVNTFFLRCCYAKLCTGQFFLCFLSLLFEVFSKGLPLSLSFFLSCWTEIITWTPDKKFNQRVSQSMVMWYNWLFGNISVTDTNWRPHHKVHQANYNIGSSSTRVRSAARTSLPELNLTATDCVASRTRSRTPQNPQALTQGTSSYDLSLSSGYSRKTAATFSDVVPSSSTTSLTSHPSTSRGRG